jgi:hypothetical protein
MRINASTDGHEEISLLVPKGKAFAVAEAVRGVLMLAGTK